MPASIDDAIALWKKGHLEDAMQACNALVAAHPHARALLAEIYSSCGQFGQAAEQLQILAVGQPGDAAAHRRLGDAQFAAGNFTAAAESFRRAIAIEPRNARARNNLGRVLMQLAQPVAAIDAYRAAVAIDPGYAIAHNNLGIALAGTGDTERALKCYERAIALNPRIAQAHCNLGNLLLQLGRPRQALESYRRALALEPDNAIMQSNCGNALMALQDAPGALVYYHQALRSKPSFVEGLNNRGNALRELRRFDEAMASYDRAIALQPDYVQAWSNKTSVLLELARYDEAIDCCDRILELRPDFPPALLHRGLSLNFMGRLRYAEAVRSFERLYQADPAQHYGLGYLLHTSAMICDWSRIKLTADALHAVAKNKPVVSPFALLSITDDAASQLQCARTCIATTHPPAANPIWNGERWQNSKLRIAYMSGDLRDHALCYLMVGVFEQHDRERFEIFGVSYREPNNNPFGARVLSSLDVFMDVSEQSDRQVAQLLRDMQIDIAVDLMGFTRGQRLNIFSHRPVPVQVSYLGYPGTSGAPYIDYLLADEFVIPPDCRQHYSENVVYLPHCFQANDDRREIAEHRPTRLEAGLPPHAFVFCSFNNAYKVNPILFDIWCRLLHAKPDSVLWMLAESDGAQANLLREAAARGIGPQRLLFAGRMSYEEHLARLPLADLFLDTLPFNAGTTASDALWAGLPILTCTGEAFAARMAGSLLRTIGLPELITHNLQEYERTALRLAESPTILAGLRERIASNRLETPLFDTQRFCRHLEAAYQAMFERQQRCEPAASFTVPPLPATRIPIRMANRL